MLVFLTCDLHMSPSCVRSSSGPEHGHGPMGMALSAPIGLELGAPRCWDTDVIGKEAGV